MVIALLLVLLGASLPPAPAVAAPRAAPAAAGVALCPPVPAGRVRCFARAFRSPAPAGHASPAAGPPAGAYTPADLQAAYALPSSTAGAGQTIAIVDAFGDPTAESDLAAYRAQFGLPACTSATGCFRGLDQWGGKNLPAPPGPSEHGWLTETALDLDMASATCPSCRLLLLETPDPFSTSVDRAVDTAAALGATEVSLSLGGPEYPGELREEVHYAHPGLAITASSGDAGFGVQYPAASRFVTAVGGTTLTAAPGSPRGWTETAWNLGGAGCSQFVPKPVWQRDAGCPRRTVVDVAAVADHPGVAVYDGAGSGGWAAIGGTSVAAPLMAGVYALAGGAGTSAPGGAAYQRLYGFADRPAPANPVNDVVSGADGNCSPAYLCLAGPGYDGPTGLGSPNGVPAPPPALMAAQGLDGAAWQGPVGSGFSSLGGVVTGPPAVVPLPASAGGGVLDIATGADRDLWVRTATAGWRRLAAAARPVCLGGPGASLDATGTVLTVACTGTDLAVWTASGPLPAGGSAPVLDAWSSLGGSLLAAPAVGIDQGAVTVLGEGLDGNVWMRTAATPWAATPWRCIGQPALAARGGTAVIACHGADGQLWTATDAGMGFGPAAPAGGGLVGGVGAAVLADGLLVDGQGLDGGVWQMYQAPGAPPGPWGPAGGMVRGGTAAAATG